MMTTSEAARTKRISAAQAKAKLSELLARVSLTDERYIIERRGKPVAALVSLEDLERLSGENFTKEPQGIWALAGLWEGTMTDEEVDEFIRHIYAEREKDKGRPVDLSHLLDG